MTIPNNSLYFDEPWVFQDGYDNGMEVARLNLDNDGTLLSDQDWMNGIPNCVTDIAGDNEAKLERVEQMWLKGCRAGYRDAMKKRTQFKRIHANPEYLLEVDKLLAGFVAMIRENRPEYNLHMEDNWNEPGPAQEGEAS